MNNTDSNPIKLSVKDLVEVEEIFDLQESNFSIKKDKNTWLTPENKKDKTLIEQEKKIDSLKITYNPSNKSITKSQQNNLNNIFSSFNNSSLLNSNSGLVYKSSEQFKNSLNSNEKFNFNHSDKKLNLTEGKDSKNIELINDYPPLENNKNNYNKKPGKHIMISSDQFQDNFFNTVNGNKDITNKSHFKQVPKQEKETNSQPSQSKNINNISYSLFKEYSYREEKNSKYRNTMEDFSKILTEFSDKSEMSFFSLYDGHGGSDPVKYVKDRIPELLSKLIKEKPNETLPNILINSFKKVDEELKFTDAENAGCTACISLLMLEKNKTILYTANVGDTRAVIFTQFSFSRLTQDHKCSDLSESERIKQSGGMIFNGRVFGQLVLTRALGDHAMKKFGVSALPSVNQTEINKDHKFLAIASDGVWDVINDDDMFRMSLICQSAEDLAKLIIETSLKKGSRDNISVLIVKFN
jgi:serine/threonine protein phosphatase PrpC